MILFLITTHLVIGAMGEMAFTHNMALDPDYHMWWKFDDKDITVKVKVNTTGWIGWGLSWNGMMRGADMVIGWVDIKGENHFHDRHAGGNYQPSMDDHQDYKLLKMSETNSFTSFTFTRKLQLSDEQDMTITQDTMRILWSWNDQDPSGDNTIPKHTKKGSRSAYLLDYGDRKRQALPNEHESLQMTMNNFPVPRHHTTYRCKKFKLPDMGVKKQHLIQVDTIITPGNEDVVHHMALYQCMFVRDDELHIGHDCDHKNMCTGIIIHAWAIGGGSFYYPPKAGLSLNTPGDPKYFILEIHYANTGERGGIVDSSGLRLYYTEELRKYDSVVLTVSIIPTARYSQIIPQQQKKFTSYGFCPSKCIDTTGGQNPLIFAAFLHTHVHGRKIVVRLVDDNSGKEVKTIAQDLNYDFNFQEVRYLKEPIEILPGHRIDVDCTYNTMDKQKPLLNGLGTQEEMCMAFLYVYPKPNIRTCWSRSRNVYTWGAKSLGWKVDGFGTIISPVFVGETSYNFVKAYKPLLNEEFWKNNERLIRSFEQSGAEEPYIDVCLFGNGTKTIGSFKNKPRCLLKDEHC